MSIKAINHTWEHVHNVTPDQKLVLLVIANSTQPDNGMASLLGTESFKNTGISEFRDVIHVLESLESKGVILVDWSTYYDNEDGRLNIMYRHFVDYLMTGDKS